MASILVTSTFAFAEDINDKPITCTKEQAKEVLTPLIGYYDDIVPEDKGLALAAEAVNEYIAYFNSEEKMAEAEPEKMAELIQQISCVVTLGSKKSLTEEMKTLRTEFHTKLTNKATTKLSELPENPEGDDVFKVANYKMMKANSQIISELIAVLKATK